MSDLYELLPPAERCRTTDGEHGRIELRTMLSTIPAYVACPYCPAYWTVVRWA